LKYDVSGKTLAGAGTFASPGALTDFKRNAWAIPLSYDAGNWRLFGAYGQTTDGSCSRIVGLVPTSCSNNDTEAKYWAIGGEYRLSKRTSVIGTYSEIKNSQFGAYTNAVGSLNGNGADGLSPGVGADPQIFAVGFRHTF
jgi:predicted porin